MAELTTNNLPVTKQPVAGGKQQLKDSSFNENIAAILGGAAGMDLNPASAQTYKAARISYDPVDKVHLFDTGYGEVRINGGQEIVVPFFNDTGVDISNGDPINASGVNVANSVLNGIVADSSSPATSSAIIGLATMPVPDQTVGLATLSGKVRDFDTTAIPPNGPVYLGVGILTNVRPTYPANIVVMGSSIKDGETDGIFYVQISPFTRNDVSRSAPFTSAGIAAGVHYAIGLYDWAAADVALTQSNLTQAYGTVGESKAAHVGIVPDGPGVVDAGQVGLKVTGIKDNQDGPQEAAQTAIITEDITTLTLDVMAECSEKFSGQVTLELYIVSGTPTTYSLQFNYGFSKYDDFFDKNSTLKGFQAEWRAGANDSAMNIELMHHKPAGWTYAATGFEPGNGNICERLVDQQLASDLVNGKLGAYKRTGLDTFIEGGGSEGFLVRFTTNQPNTIQMSDVEINAVSEELS